LIIDLYSKTKLKLKNRPISQLSIGHIFKISISRESKLVIQFSLCIAGVCVEVNWHYSRSLHSFYQELN